MITDEQTKQSLQDRNIRLRENRPDGTPIQLYYANGGDYIIAPLADYDKKLHDIVIEHPNLTQQEKDLLDANFVYAVAVQVDEDGNEAPYFNLTLHEFDMLYNKSSSSIFTDKNGNGQYKVIEIPRMFDHAGERQLIYLFGKGYSIPNYTMCPAKEAIRGLINEVQV